MQRPGRSSHLVHQSKRKLAEDDASSATPPNKQTAVRYVHERAVNNIIEKMYSSKLISAQSDVTTDDIDFAASLVRYREGLLDICDQYPVESTPDRASSLTALVGSPKPSSPKKETVKVETAVKEMEARGKARAVLREELKHTVALLTPVRRTRTHLSVYEQAKADYFSEHVCPVSVGYSPKKQSAGMSLSRRQSIVSGVPHVPGGSRHSHSHPHSHTSSQQVSGAPSVTGSQTASQQPSGVPSRRSSMNSVRSSVVGSKPPMQMGKAGEQQLDSGGAVLYDASDARHSQMFVPRRTLSASSDLSSLSLSHTSQPPSSVPVHLQTASKPPTSPKPNVQFSKESPFSSMLPSTIPSSPKALQTVPLPFSSTGSSSSPSVPPTPRQRRLSSSSGASGASKRSSVSPVRSPKSTESKSQSNSPAHSLVASSSQQDLRTVETTSTIVDQSIAAGEMDSKRLQQEQDLLLLQQAEDTMNTHIRLPSRIWPKVTPSRIPSSAMIRNSISPSRRSSFGFGGGNTSVSMIAQPSSSVNTTSSTLNQSVASLIPPLTVPPPLSRRSKDTIRAQMKLDRDAQIKKIAMERRMSVSYRAIALEERRTATLLPNTSDMLMSDDASFSLSDSGDEHSPSKRHARG